MNARHLIAAAIAVVGLVGLANCSSAPGGTDSAGPPFGTSEGGEAGSPTADIGEDAGSANGAFPGAPDSSRGLILVHGSPNLPAFRLCFGMLSPTGYLVTGASSALPPLPNRDLMPDSNVVGVEIGSAVRLNPLSDVGVDPAAHVFAIPEVFVRPGMGADFTCGARICPVGSSTCLPKDPPVPGQRGFYDLGPLPAGAVSPNVQLLVVHGCVPGTTVDGGAPDGGAPSASCGADYDPAVGNLKLDVLPLNAYKTQTPTQFFVQAAQLSDAVVGRTLGVTYGELGNSASQQDLGLSSNFGQIAPSGTPRVFDLDRTAPGIYGSQGFEITLAGQVFSQSLAEIQLTTAPQAVPDDLYSAESNFVMLLLGDPALSDAQGNALSPMTEPGLLLHLLVVPVGQPPDSDAGLTDAGGG